MAVLTYAEMTDLTLDRAGVNVATDAPVSAAELLRRINDAYGDVWEAAGGAMTSVTGASTTWLPSPTVATASLSLSCTTNGTTTVTSAALFGSVVAGMRVAGTGIPQGAYVAAVATTSSLTLSVAATDSTTAARSFVSNPGQLIGALRDINEVLNVAGAVASSALVGDASTTLLDRVEYSRIQWLRAQINPLLYQAPQMYSIERRRASSDVAANANQYNLDVWPGTTGYYFPMEYIRQFSPLAGVGTDVPDVNDIESRDICLLAAMQIAPLVGLARLVPSIAVDISERTAKMLERKLQSLASADQDA